MSDKTRVAIMQPYLFPYIGYFQLIQAVDKFVIHDDVQYIKGGWINRNRIRFNDKAYLFTFSLKKDSSHKNINTRSFSDQFEAEKSRFLRIMYQHYHTSPYFDHVNDVLSTIMEDNNKNISTFITHSLKLICGYLEIPTLFALSSELLKNNTLKGQDRVIDICKREGAEFYINLSGGVKLYAKGAFRKHGITLLFLHPKDIPYEGNVQPVIPNLSIIDVMMFNSKDRIRDFLRSFYTLS